MRKTFLKRSCPCIPNRSLSLFDVFCLISISTLLSFSKGMLAKFVSSLLASHLSLSLILKSSAIHMSIQIKDYISDLTVEVGDHVG